MSRLTRDGIAEPVSRDQCSGANTDRETFIFAVQQTTCRIGNLTQLIHALLAICVTIHTYIKCALSYETARGSGSTRPRNILSCDEKNRPFDVTTDSTDFKIKNKGWRIRSSGHFFGAMAKDGSTRCFFGQKRMYLKTIAAESVVGRI